MCCKRLAGNTGRKNDANKSPSEHHRTTSGYIFTTKARIDNRKTVVKQHYLLQMPLQYSELRPTSGWDQLASLEHPVIFQRVSRLGSVTARLLSSGRQQNCGFEQTAPPMFGRATIIYGRPYVIGQTIYIFILFLLSSFFSSPNLSSRRLDVYHTSAHGVVLV